MRYFFSYLFRSPLIRLTSFWLVIAIVGITLFSWKIFLMRKELSDTNSTINSFVAAIHQLDRQKLEEKEKLDTVLREIEKYRPSVPDLLGFVNNVETLGEEKGLDIKLTTIKTGDEPHKDGESVVNYKITLEATLPEIKQFIRDFEATNYATRVRNIDISEVSASLYRLNFVFVLHTKLT